MSLFSEDEIREASANWSMNDSVLGRGWQWSTLRPQKVRKDNGTYMRARGNCIEYEAGRNGFVRGVFTINCDYSPYISMIMLTHFEDELKQYISENVA